MYVVAGASALMAICMWLTFREFILHCDDEIWTFSFVSKKKTSQIVMCQLQYLFNIR